MRFFTVLWRSRAGVKTCGKRDEVEEGMGESMGENTTAHKPSGAESPDSVLPAGGRLQRPAADAAGDLET
jgi:hypothetical protein